MKPTFFLVAIGVVGLLISGATAGTPAVAQPIFVVSALAVVTSLVMFGKDLLSRKRDPYDLNLLREIHEAPPSDEFVGKQEWGDVLCPVCGTEYPGDRLVCPRCGR